MSSATRACGVCQVTPTQPAGHSSASLRISPHVVGVDSQETQLTNPLPMANAPISESNQGRISTAALISPRLTIAAVRTTQGIPKTTNSSIEASSPLTPRLFRSSCLFCSLFSNPDFELSGKAPSKTATRHSAEFVPRAANTNIEGNPFRALGTVKPIENTVSKSRATTQNSRTNITTACTAGALEPQLHRTYSA